MSTQTQNRQPKGIPAGGQFAETRRADADVTLTSDDIVTPSARYASDDEALDSIAGTLGFDEEWDGVGSYLETIATQIHMSGRPHPGNYDQDTEAFRRDFDAYLAKRGPATTPATKALDEMATILGETRDWGADEMEYLAGAVALGERPHPGDAGGGARYWRKLAASALENGRRQRDARDDFEDNIAKGAYGPNNPILKQMLDRELIPNEYGFDSEAMLEPEMLARVDEDFLAEVTKEREQITAGIREYTRDCARWAPEGMTDPDEKAVRTHLAQQLADEDDPQVADIIWQAVADDRQARLGVMAVGRADFVEMNDEYIDPAIDRLEERLRTADK